MIDVFESIARANPSRVCFTFVDNQGKSGSYSFRQVRLMAASAAHRLQSAGVGRGDCVLVDLPNCPEFVFLLLACAYGSFTLVPVNNRLTAAEKQSRQFELEKNLRARIAYRVDSARVRRLFDNVQADLQGIRNRRVIMGARQDAEEEAIHFAERQAHLFNDAERALIMFTSGTTGKPKAVALTWRQVVSSAKISNKLLNRPGEGLWQAALPMYHIGGMQVVLRSVLNRNPFVLYGKFDAKRLLDDARRMNASHVSVVDKMLQDMLAADVHGVLPTYECILLGGAALNKKTLARALRAGARVYASYGMTETSSQIAHTLVTRQFDGGMRLMPGYAARIVDADAEGFGRLAVCGPGVFEGYLNARAAFTVDGFFLTGDTAALRMGKIYVKERTADMFVSGGENVYPAEIADKLLHVSGVADAFVFGAPDAKWGRRPVAFVERAEGGDFQDPASFTASVYEQISHSLSKLYRPRYLFAVDKLPRTGIGKIDRVAVEHLYESRIEIKRVILHVVRIPFRVPFKTAKATLTHRDSLIVEVVDHAGRVGLGECVAFATDWYLPETIDQDIEVLQQVLAPKVLSETYLHPREAAASLAVLPEVAAFPLACGALEPALWDLYGKIVGKPLWELVGEEASAASKAAGTASVVSVPAGAVVGLGTTAETLEAVRRSAEAGYRRVKLKVGPGSVACVRQVCEAFPQLMITLDANQSFTERDMRELHELDRCGAAWIEEPIDISRISQRAGKSAVFERLARLQRSLSTPICLDESFTCAAEAYQALEFSELRCFAIKIGKFGGVKGALAFALAAQERGACVWMGGMYDTGISKRLHAAFETLPGIDAPGDIGATSRYFSIDITDPPHTVTRGRVVLNQEHAGLGCNFYRPALSNVQIGQVVIE